MACPRRRSQKISDRQKYRSDNENADDDKYFG